MATVEFYGDTFTLNAEVSEIALMEFAEAAADGGDGDTLQGMAAMMRLTKDCIADTDLKRFLVVARKNHAGSTELIQVIMAMAGQVTERPTERPSDSSDGPVVIGLKSASSSVDKGLERLSGRPDLQLAVIRQRQSA